MAQKRRKNKKSKKLLSIVLFLVLFVAAGIVAYLVWDGYFKEEKKLFILSFFLIEVGNRDFGRGFPEDGVI